MTNPNGLFLRRGQVFQLLEKYDITRWATRQMLEDGTIKPVYLTRKGKGKKRKPWAYFSSIQIHSDILDKLNNNLPGGPAPGGTTSEKKQ